MSEPISIRVNIADYETNLGKFSGQRTIAEYSVTDKLEVLNDRTNARYICEQSIRNNTNYDLTAGFNSFVDKDVLLQNAPALGTFRDWAMGQEGDTLKEVLGGADFASWRGTMKRIASSLIYEPPRTTWNNLDYVNKMLKKSAWSVVAQDFGGVIILCETKTYDGGSTDLATYTGFKFEQYITSNTPNGTPNTSVAVNSQPTFEIMVRSDLEMGDDKLKLCCGAELDAIRIVNNEEQKIEIKTVWENDWKTDRSMNIVMQNEIVGVKNFLIGKKRGDIRRKFCNVIEVFGRNLDDYKSMGDTGRVSSQCYAFLFDVLSKTKEFLQSNEACRVSFNPTELVVEIKSISKEEANFKGHGFSDEFITRFNI